MFHSHGRPGSTYMNLHIHVPPLLPRFGRLGSTGYTRCDMNVTRPLTKRKCGQWATCWNQIQQVDEIRINSEAIMGCESLQIALREGGGMKPRSLNSTGLSCSFQKSPARSSKFVSPAGACWTVPKGVAVGRICETADASAKGSTGA